MSFLQLAIALFAGASVLIFLFFGTFVFLFMERLANARMQHREGPGRHGSIELFQVWKDFRKSGIKLEEGPGLSLRFRLAVQVWKLLPAVFLLILLGGLFPMQMAGAELPSLLLLPFLASFLEGVFLHASTDAREKFEWRRRIILRAMGASVMAFSFFAAALQIGIPSLVAVSELQSHFPYHSLFSSPGLFICGMAALGAIFLFVSESPIQNESELSLGRSMHYAIFFVRRMWVFCLLAFWVFVFLGGSAGIANKVLFPLKLAVMLFAFTLLQGSFPRIRSADAGELAIRWLFRLCILGFLVEAVWVGVG